MAECAVCEGKGYKERRDVVIGQGTLYPRGAAIIVTARDTCSCRHLQTEFPADIGNRKNGDLSL